MPRIKLCLVTATLGISLLAPIAPKAEPAGSPAAGEIKLRTEVCQECHGNSGTSISPYVPKLAGQFTPYIAKQIHDFQTGARKHPIMTVMAESLDDGKLYDIAAFFSSRPKVRDEEPDTNAVGRRLFLAGDSARGIPPCSSCHGQDGAGRSDEDSLVPMIGGQRKGYLINQLLAWRNGDRKNSPDGTMNMIAKLLTDSDIDKVAGFISGL